MTQINKWIKSKSIVRPNHAKDTTRRIHAIIVRKKSEPIHSFKVSVDHQCCMFL